MVDKYGRELSLYVPKWGLLIESPFGYEFDTIDALLCNDYLWTIASSREAKNTIKTLKFSQNGELIESYQSTLPFVYENDFFCDILLANCYKEDCFFISFLDAAKINQKHYTIQTFQSKDHGKTWIRQENLQGGYYDDHLRKATFFTNELGVVAFRESDDSHLEEILFFTFNGGDTWTPIGEIIYPVEPDEWISVDSIIWQNEVCILTLRLGTSDTNGFYLAEYLSADLINWELVGYCSIE